MGCRVRGMTTQEYRRSYDYRSAYFKTNPGLFGYVWFCSQCYRPLLGRSNVVVDHIVPLNKGGRNHVSNCTAICAACNSSKSDKVDGRIVKGKVFKVFESTASRANRGAGAVIGLGAGLTMGLASSIFSRSGRVARGTARVGARGIAGLLSVVLRVALIIPIMAFRVIAFPIKHGTFVSRLCFLAIYAMVVMYFLQNNTELLNAWT